MILGAIFQDGAVLQRDMDIPVWGKAAADSVVKCEFDNTVSATRSSASGDFILYLPPHDAGGPFELKVFIPGNEDEKIICRDVMVGEVWLASGQSNMAYMLSSRLSAGFTATADEQEKLFPEMVMDPERLRMFTVEKCASGAPESSCSGQWAKAYPDKCGTMSAVAAWFALGLQYHLDVPVGIITSAWGGTIAEAWMSNQALSMIPETSGLAAAVRRSRWQDKRWGETGRQFNLYEDLGYVKKDSGNNGEAMGYAGKNFDDSQWKTMKVPGSWIKQYISGNGAVWLRQSVQIPGSWAGCDLLLTGGAVDKHDISYFNGVEIGRTGKDLEVEYYNTIRSYPVPGRLVNGGQNIVAIRAFSFAHDGSVTGDWQLVNQVTGEKIHLNSQWRAKAEYDWGRVDCKRGGFGPDNPNTPGILFDGMIRPLIPAAIRGVIWYQGESNADNRENARNYRNILQNLIGDWRRQWGLPEMPFIIVQLAGYGERNNFFRESPWAELRESQRLLAKNDPHIFMSSAIDLGEESDIHPQNKKDVGKRLAMSALHHIYGCQDAVPSGPEVLKAYATADGRVKIDFARAEGLKLTSTAHTFFLTDEKGDCRAAEQLEIDDSSVIISGGNAANAVEVYYAWTDFPETALYNAAGSPASSFRIGVERA